MLLPELDELEPLENKTAPDLPEIEDPPTTRTSPPLTRGSVDEPDPPIISIFPPVEIP
jgi:hypothetical protein